MDKNGSAYIAAKRKLNYSPTTIHSFKKQQIHPFENLDSFNDVSINLSDITLSTEKNKLFGSKNVKYTVKDSKSSRISQSKKLNKTTQTNKSSLSRFLSKPTSSASMYKKRKSLSQSMPIKNLSPIVKKKSIGTQTPESRIGSGIDALDRWSSIGNNMSLVRGYHSDETPKWTPFSVNRSTISDKTADVIKTKKKKKNKTASKLDKITPDISSINSTAVKTPASNSTIITPPRKPSAKRRLFSTPTSLTSTPGSSVQKKISKSPNKNKETPDEERIIYVPTDKSCSLTFNIGEKQLKFIYQPTQHQSFQPLQDVSDLHEKTVISKYLNTSQEAKALLNEIEKAPQEQYSVDDKLKPIRRVLHKYKSFLNGTEKQSCI